MRATRPSERGSALVVTLLVVLLLSAAGASMVALASIEARAASNQRDARVTLAAASGALARAAAELMALSDWNDVLAGGRQSSQVDGPAHGSRVLPGGSILVLETLPNLAGCGLPGPCTPAALDAVTLERPWGTNNPRWRLFAYGGFPPQVAAPAVYTVVMVADDPAEVDGDPSTDAWPGQPGAGVVMMRAEAFGPGGARRTVEVVVARQASGGIAGARVLTWSQEK